MNKTAIFTIQKVKNYGASLQAFALQTKLNKLDVSNEIIDFKRIYVKEQRIKNKYSFIGLFLFRLISKMKQFRRYLLNLLAFKDISLNKLHAKSILFDNFEDKYLTHSKSIQESKLTKLNKDYSNFICGSDQVWNHTFAFSIEAYFLDFVEDSKNKIAFAPSFGIEKVPAAKYKKYKRSFDRFNHLSVREQQGASIIKEITGNDAEVIVDPIFLLNKKEWIQQLNLKKETNPKKYILCYTLGAEDKIAVDVCRNIKKKTGYEIIKLGRSKDDLNFKDINVKWNVGPVEFLELILNSSLVVTNSFHGTAFSLNFMKPFFCVLAKNNLRTSRLKNILKIANLKERIIFEFSTFVTDNLDLNYEENVNQIIKDEREKSIRFLEKALK